MVCVRGIFETNLKLKNKPKTLKENIVGRVLSIVVCVCEMFETNPKLENKPKTRNQKIVGWALSIVVCVWNVRNKPKTRKQTQNYETKDRGAGVENVVCVCGIFDRWNRQHSYIVNIVFLNPVIIIHKTSNVIGQKSNGKVNHNFCRLTKRGACGAPLRSALPPEMSAP